jgi:PAS domain S-box-containing protein
MIKTKLHILMVEDDPLDAELNKEQLRQLEEYECIFLWVKNREDYLNVLETTIPDLILCDYNLPQYNGSQALKDLREINKLIPFIFVTGTMNEETAADAIKSGAWDYVVKDRLFRLPLAVRSVLNLKVEKDIATQAEEKIKRLITAIDQSSAQIMVIGTEGTIEYVNQKFTEITGYTSDEVISKNILSLGSEEACIGINQESLNNLKRGIPFRGEVLSQKKNGSTFWELVFITPIANSQGEYTYFVAVKEDITHRKEMEFELIKAKNKAEQSDKLKDAFLQNMSHEIRTPLNAIVGFSDLLGNSDDLTEESIKNYTSIICTSSNQLLAIVSDVLTIASIQTGQENVMFRPVNLNRLLSQQFEIYNKVIIEKNINFIYNPADNNPALIINTDETKLLQIVNNLLNNAIKFTQDGIVEFGFYHLGNHVEIYVKDSGIGISKENQEKIFERFFRVDTDTVTTNRGTGLGLSISQSFAGMLGGLLKVDSDLGKGSTFTLILPYK